MPNVGDTREEQKSEKVGDNNREHYDLGLLVIEAKYRETCQKYQNAADGAKLKQKRKIFVLYNFAFVRIEI